MASGVKQIDESDSEVCIPRTKRTYNLPGLASRSEHVSGCKTLYPRLQQRSTNSGSENGDGLYMSISRHRDRNSRSLSIISNQSDPKLDGSYDREATPSASSAPDNAVEGSSWDIIGREIYNWQYVCRTGRPYWWSPKAGHGRLNIDRACPGYEPGTRIWAGESNDRPRDEHRARRRAVSDGFLTDFNNVGDIAHMVAIQLLSSCFTLPPESADPSSSQNGGLSEKNRSTSLNDLNSPMISSLKMHTHYRYSPCFGHQGRNTSPEHTSPDPSHDYTSGSPSTPLEASMHTLDIGTSDTLARRRRVHRALHVTEGSATNCSLDSHTDEYLKSCTRVTSNPLSKASKLQQTFFENTNLEDSASETYVEQETPANAQNRELLTSSDTFSRRPQASNEFKLANRLESQHDFMQPVKDIVSRRWNSLRRRLGSSHHSNTHGSELGEYSAGSRASSPASASNGRERRRRARASGDISSYESTPHFNSPVSSNFSPAGSEASGTHPADRETSPVSNTLAEPVSEAISSALKRELSDVVARRSSATSNVHRSPESCGRCKPSNSLDEDPSGSVNSHSMAEVNQAEHKVSPSARKSRSRQRRKSMLSEVFTAEDLDDETESDTADATAPISPAEDELEPAPRVSLAASLSSWETEQLELLRTSTSGTQIFTPRDEGIEIDGLSVGPCRHAWDGPGKKRERSYL